MGKKNCPGEKLRPPWATPGLSKVFKKCEVYPNSGLTTQINVQESKHVRLENSRRNSWCQRPEIRMNALRFPTHSDHLPTHPRTHRGFLPEHCWTHSAWTQTKKKAQIKTGCSKNVREIEICLPYCSTARSLYLIGVTVGSATRGSSLGPCATFIVSVSSVYLGISSTCNGAHRSMQPPASLVNFRGMRNDSDLGMLFASFTKYVSIVTVFQVFQSSLSWY